MKRPSVRRRVLLPSWLLMLLIPALICGTFEYAAKRYAEDQCRQQLHVLCERLDRAIQESEGDPERLDTVLRDGIYNSVNRSKLVDGVMLFSESGTLLYSTELKEPAEPAALADALFQAISRGEDHFQPEGQGAYLFQTGQRLQLSGQACRLAAYCSDSVQEDWVKPLTIRVMLIAYVLNVAAFFCLWSVTNRVNKTLQKLCAGAERFGQGSFSPIEPEFGLREPEELRQSMNRMALELQRADNRQQEFLQDMSHELRTRLMSITGYAQAIEQKVFPDPTQAAGVILEESQRLTDVVNSMLKLSRLESQITTELHPIRLAELAADRLEACRPQAGALSLELDPGEEDLRPLGQEALVETVLDNLLSNALRYGRTLIRVRLWRDGDRALLAVENDGPGIPAEELPHVFDRFYKGSEGNFGLGLPIARNAARCMDGNLEAENCPDTGVRFTLTLTLAPVQVTG